MSIHLRIISLPLVFGMGHVNSYLIKTGADFILIDTGSAHARRQLHEELQAAGCFPGSLKVILLTHGDFDHTGNAVFLRTTYGVQIAMHSGDSGMVERADMFFNRKKPNRLISTLLSLFMDFKKEERFTPDVLLSDEENLEKYGLRARILSLPGHSRGSIGILTEDGDLFCGDLFENTRIPALNSLLDDIEEAYASCARLDSFKIKTVYPGHGLPFDMELMREPIGA